VAHPIAKQQGRPVVWYLVILRRWINERAPGRLVASGRPPCCQRSQVRLFCWDAFPNRSNIYFNSHLFLFFE